MLSRVVLGFFFLGGVGELDALLTQLSVGGSFASVACLQSSWAAQGRTRVFRFSMDICLPNQAVSFRKSSHSSWGNSLWGSFLKMTSWYLVIKKRERKKTHFPIFWKGYPFFHVRETKNTNLNVFFVIIYFYWGCMWLSVVQSWSWRQIVELFCKNWTYAVQFMLIKSLSIF